MNQFSHIYNDKLGEDIQKRLDEAIMNQLTASIYDGAITTTTSIIAEEPFTLEKLMELYKSVEPYIEYERQINEYLIPKYEFKVDNKTEIDRFLYSYGTTVLKPTKTIIIKVQKRTHKQKRINKKWLKKYGYVEVKKEIPDYGIFMNVTA